MLTYEIWDSEILQLNTESPFCFGTYFFSTDSQVEVKVNFTRSKYKWVTIYWLPHKIALEEPWWGRQRWWGWNWRFVPYQSTRDRLSKRFPVLKINISYKVNVDTSILFWVIGLRIPINQSYRKYSQHLVDFMRDYIPQTCVCFVSFFPSVFGT